MTRLARAAAESLATESGTDLSVALGSLPPSHGTPRQLAAILTHRELSVLRFLPSHLTYAEIARECIMSVNTVKTHLKRIYAKLGVSSRAETVERARLLGLLLHATRSPFGSFCVVQERCDRGSSRPRHSGSLSPGRGS